MKNLYLCVLALLVLAGTANAANVYVDPSCANNGDGTSSAGCAGSPGGVGPFNTWVGMTFTAGNSYLQKRDTTYTGMLQMTTGGSTPTNRVILDAYGTGAKPKIVGAGVQMALRLDGTLSFITISNFDVCCVDTVAGNRFNVRLCNILCTDIQLNHMDIHDPVDPGSPYEADGIWGQCTDCTFDDVTIYNIGSDGIWLNNVGNFTLKNSYIYNVATDMRATGDSVQLEGTGGILTVVNNILDHRSVAAKQTLNDSTLTLGTSGLIMGNQFYMSNNQAQSQSKNVTARTDNVLFISNLVSGGWRCLNHSGTGWIIYGNVITGCYNVGWIAEGTIKSQDTTTRLMNNTIDGLNDQQAKSGFCGYMQKFSTGTVGYFYNNIFTNCEFGVAVEATTTVFNGDNLFYNNTTNTSGAAWSMDGSNLVNVNPLYMNMVSNGDFRLNAGSPARRAGRSGLPCKDYRGRPCYPDSPDIGAYQSSSGDPATTRSAASTRAAASTRTAATTRTAR